MSSRRHACPCKNQECDICFKLFWFRPSMLTPDLEIQPRASTINMGTDAAASKQVEAFGNAIEHGGTEIQVDAEPGNGTLEIAPQNNVTGDCMLMNGMGTSFSYHYCPIIMRTISPSSCSVSYPDAVQVKKAEKRNTKIRRSRLRRGFQPLLTTPPRYSAQLFRRIHKLVKRRKVYLIKQQLLAKQKRTEFHCAQCGMQFKFRSALLSHKTQLHPKNYIPSIPSQLVSVEGGKEVHQIRSKSTEVTGYWGNGSEDGNNFSPTTIDPTNNGESNKTAEFPIEATEVTNVTNHALTGEELRSLPNESPLLSIEDERGVWEELGMDAIDFPEEELASEVRSMECYPGESRELESELEEDMITMNDNHSSPSLSILDMNPCRGLQEDAYHPRPISGESELLMSDSGGLATKMGETDQQNQDTALGTRPSGEHRIIRIKIKMTGVVVQAFKCSVCDKLFTEKGNASRHVRGHTGGKLFKCSLCDKQFLRKDSLKRHLKSHIAVKSVKCNHCDATFTTEGHRRRHFLNFHCGKGSGNSDNKALYKCGICPKRYKFKVRLQKHLDTIHARVENYPPG